MFLGNSVWEKYKYKKKKKTHSFFIYLLPQFNGLYKQRAQFGEMNKSNTKNEVSCILTKQVFCNRDQIRPWMSLHGHVWNNIKETAGL